MEPFNTGRWLQQTLDYAIACRASDVHLTCRGQELRVDFRHDGKIRPFVHLTAKGDEMVRRLKALARMDVTNHHVAQEGSFTWDVQSKRVNVRVSALPIYDGESIVLRILHNMPQHIDLHRIGFKPDQLIDVMQLLERQSGLLFVAGKPGVGKTTTLYAMMNYLADRGRQVFSLEDPVEVPLANCRQIEIRERTGMTYETSLRTLLRQDPDVLMIGEVRDQVTARIAVRAALTGRLVLATTHAATGRLCVRRMLDLGVDASALQDVLAGVLVQSTKNWTSEFSVTHIEGETEERSDLLVEGDGRDRHDWKIRRTI